jgi:hypothetical protein
MTKGIFADNAQTYYDAGYSGIPTDGKKPLLNGWQKFGQQPPSMEQVEAWRVKYPDANIGLVTGCRAPDGTELIAFDVDDDRFLRVTRAVVGAAAPEKRGQKGGTLFVRAEPDQIKSTSFKTSEKSGAIDILAAKKQSIIPPSTHPDSGMPYEWVGAALLDWDIANIPKTSPKQLKLLKAVVHTAQTNDKTATQNLVKP